MFIIEKDLAQKLINYLAQKPYAEVYQFMVELQLMQPYKEQAHEHNGELAEHPGQL